MSTYYIALETEHMGKNKGNAGKDYEYGYTYFPNIVSFNPGDTDMEVILTGSTASRFRIHSYSVNGQPPITPDSRTIKVNLSYSDKHEMCPLTIYIYDSKNGHLFSCDPQVHNTKPPG